MAVMLACGAGMGMLACGAGLGTALLRPPPLSPGRLTVVRQEEVAFLRRPREGLLVPWQVWCSLSCLPVSTLLFSDGGKWQEPAMA